MDIAADRQHMVQRVICDRCGEVIGVYEPAVLVAAGQARNTSLAAEPTVRERAGRLYHRCCITDARASGQQPVAGQASRSPVKPAGRRSS